MNDPRICIVGAGNLSTKRIYPNVGAAGGILAGVCDIDTEKAERNALRFGGNVYADMKEMIEKESPDGVIICINADYHVKLGMEVVNMGIPVYTEKPPAMNAADALEAARLSKEKGILHTVAFKKRYNRAYSRAKEWIDGFDGDDLYSLSIDYTSSRYRNEHQLKTLIFDYAIHAIDLTGYLFGDTESLFCFSKGMDAYAVSLKFRSGAVGTLNFNCGRGAFHPTEEVEITARGGNAMTLHNSACWRISRNKEPSEWYEPPTCISAGDSGHNTGHLSELIDFFEAVRENRTTRSNIYESYKSMVLYEAICKSTETEQPVQVEYSEI